MEAIMTATPTQLLYTKTHEWVRRDSENTITIGITEHAADALGDIVFVDLPEVGESFSSQQDIAVIESVKTAADVYAALAGTVSAVNDTLNSTPELVNQSPFDDGWLFTMTIDDPSQLNQLLNADAYQAHTEAE